SPLPPLGVLDMPTRAAIARKLASYAQAPHAVVCRLARDVIEVAEPILKSSPCLSGDDLVAIIRDCGTLHAAAIGARNGPAAPEGARVHSEQARVLPLPHPDMTASPPPPPHTLPPPPPPA